MSAEKNTHNRKNPDQNFLHRALKSNPSNTFIIIITEYEYVVFLLNKASLIGYKYFISSLF